MNKTTVLLFLILISGCGRHPNAVHTNQAMQSRRPVPVQRAPSVSQEISASLEGPKLEFTSAEVGFRIESEDHTEQPLELDGDARPGFWINRRAVELEGHASRNYRPVFLTIPGEIRGIRWTEVKYRIVREHYSDRGFLFEPLTGSLPLSAEFVLAKAVWRLPLHRIRDDFRGIDPLERVQLHLTLSDQRGRQANVVAQLRINALDPAIEVQSMPARVQAGREAASSATQFTNLSHRPRQLWLRVDGSIRLESQFQRQWTRTVIDRGLVHPGRCFGSFLLGPSTSPIYPFIREPVRRSGQEMLPGTTAVHGLAFEIENDLRLLADIGGWKRIWLNPGHSINAAVRQEAFPAPSPQDPGNRCASHREFEIVPLPANLRPFRYGQCETRNEIVSTSECQLASVRRVPEFRRAVRVSDMGQETVPEIEASLRFPD